jgi:hypothetical protein
MDNLKHFFSQWLKVAWEKTFPGGKHEPSVGIGVNNESQSDGMGSAI